MPENFRRFTTGPDPFGRPWDVEFRWQQNGISIRHADTVDVKFNIWTADEPKQEKVVAIPHPDLLRLGEALGKPVSDAWVADLAARRLRHMIESGEDMEKTLVTASYPDLERHARE